MEWDSYFGQEKLKARLRVHIEAAKTQQHRMDHVILIAPPGYGKSTIARLIGEELDTDFYEVICPYDDSLMNKIVAGFSGVLLLDEIHRLSTRQQENLLPLIQEGYLQTKGGGRIESNWLCVIGATTEPDKVIAPLYDRFPIKPTFEDYTDSEMAQIVKIKMEDKGVFISDEHSLRFGAATGGVPRLATDIAVMARDLKTSDVEPILNMLELSSDGLGKSHHNYIMALASCGGTAGLSLLEAHLRLPTAILLDIERLLIKKDYIEYSKGGRRLQTKAYQQFDIQFLP